ncbi:MAG: ATP-binding cassette domain-containing protein [Coriobacteriales bacterium]|jgi:molybdate transport system ATP-binding protein|nr:ATP-binding cassette domain-containing protein [Coriobacteriales bacterium]
MSLVVDIRKELPTFRLDVRFEAGNETLGLLGASGCGKSLTLRCIAGLERPDEGRIVVAGRTFFDSAQGIDLTAQQRKTALLFQSYMLFPHLTVAENIAAGIPRRTPKAELHAIVSEQLLRFGLKGFGSRYPIRLSGGQQQRVALARMLVANPAILMLDEPFSALDSHLKASLEYDLLDLFDGFEGSIVYVSHDIDEAFRFCDRIAVIDQGSLREVAPTAQIRDRPTTYATMRVSGVKNISAACKRGDHRVEALDWGITLETEAPVPDDVAFLGVRAAFIRSAAPGAPNSFEARVRRIVDSRFERTALLQPSAAAAQQLQWRFDKSLAEPPSPLCSSAYPAACGASVLIEIPPSRIYLVTS